MRIALPTVAAGDITVRLAAYGCYRTNRNVREDTRAHTRRAIIIVNADKCRQTYGIESPFHRTTDGGIPETLSVKVLWKLCSYPMTCHTMQRQHAGSDPGRRRKPGIRRHTEISAMVSHSESGLKLWSCSSAGQVDIAQLANPRDCALVHSESNWCLNHSSSAPTRLLSRPATTAHEPRSCPETHPREAHRITEGRDTIQCR